MAIASFRNCRKLAEPPSAPTSVIRVVPTRGYSTIFDTGQLRVLDGQEYWTVWGTPRLRFWPMAIASFCYPTIAGTKRLGSRGLEGRVAVSGIFAREVCECVPQRSGRHGRSFGNVCAGGVNSREWTPKEIPQKVGRFLNNNRNHHANTQKTHQKNFLDQSDPFWV